MSTLASCCRIPARRLVTPASLPSTAVRYASSSSGFPDSSAAPPPRTHGQQRRGVSIAAAIAIGVAGYGLALTFPPSFYRFLYPTPIAGAPAKDSKEGRKATQQIEDDLQNLEMVKELRSQYLGDEGKAPNTPNTTSLTEPQTSRVRKWKESRPFARIPDEKKKHSLTQYTLRGPGKFAVTPLVFSSQDDKECVAFLHAGEMLCGHNGIIHGGLLATILDEAVARPAFYSLPNRIGMTAYLNVRYKAPTTANQFLVVRASSVKVDGRKAWVKGSIETLEGKLLVEADALYVEPKNAWMLQSSAVKEAFD